MFLIFSTLSHGANKRTGSSFPSALRVNIQATQELPGRTTLEPVDFAVNSCGKVYATLLLQNPSVNKDELDLFMSEKIQTLKKAIEVTFGHMDVPLISGVKSARTKYKRNIEEIFKVSGIGFSEAE